MPARDYYIRMLEGLYAAAFERKQPKFNQPRTDTVTSREEIVLTEEEAATYENPASPVEYGLVASGGTGSKWGECNYGPTSSLAARHDATNITGLADGALVDTWPDNSSRDQDGTGSGASRPTYETDGVNGQPTVRFAGSHQIIVPYDGFDNDNFTLIFAVRPTSVTGLERFFVRGRSGGSGRIEVARNGAAWTVISNTSGITLDGGAAAIGVTAVVAVRIVGDASNLWVNNVLVDADDLNQNVDAGGGSQIHYLGRGEPGAEFWNGDIDHAQYINAAVTDAILAQIVAELMTKYGVS